MFTLPFLSLCFSLTLSSPSSFWGRVPPDHLGSFSPSMACLQFKERAVKDLIHHYFEILPLKLITPSVAPVQLHHLELFTGPSSLDSPRWTERASDGCKRMRTHRVQSVWSLAVCFHCSVLVDSLREPPLSHVTCTAVFLCTCSGWIDHSYLHTCRWWVAESILSPKVIWTLQADL